MALKVLLILGVLSFVTCSNKIDRSREAIDSSFLENVLDEEECDRQITALLSSQSHLLKFMDAGIRIPRGVYTGNFVDLGNYHQCLAMEQQFQGVQIEGKYCSILIPMEQDDSLLHQDMRGFHFDPRSLRLDNETISKIEEYNLRRIELLALSGRLDVLQHERPLVLRLGVCIPKPCTAKHAIDSVYNVTDELGLHYYEDYCRLPGDKTWVPADYTAVCILGALGLLTFFSTCYDLFYRFLMNKDVNQISKLGRSFSVYTNGKRLTTFSDGGETLQCLDGIRTLTVLWVIVGHAYNSESFIANPFDLQEWKFSIRALWITGATMTVDTFFTVTGVLLVYTTAGKMTPKTFLKNLHWFYLYRYIRLTPLLAVAVLLQASFLNRIADGPYWQSVAYATETCRTNWWTTLLHVQNLVNPDDMCIPHAWYVAIEFQLFMISPLVLLWVFSGKKLYAWVGVIGALVLVIGGSTIYTFHINVPGGNLVPSRLPELADYLRKYYFFTLTRAAPFFVGLVFGYLLHLFRHKKLYLPWPIAILFWVNALGILGGIFYFKYSIKQLDWENELMDNLMNSLMRPAYACTICWIITACVHGYGGPINWLLSHEVWRLPARLTYGMYLFHYPLMFTINGAAVSPTFFSVEGLAFKFVAHTVVAFVWSFFLTLLVDSPITVLVKQLMGSAVTTTPIVKIDEPAEEDMEENLDSNVAIQRNMETLDENDEDIIDSDDANSEIYENLSQSSSDDGDSVSEDTASEDGSNDVNPELSQHDPNEVKSHTSGSAVDPSGSGIGLNNKINEETMATIHSRDKTVDPSTARTNSSDIDVEANVASINPSDRVEPSTSRSNSQLKTVEPNAASINSSNSPVAPSTVSSKPSEKTVELTAAPNNISDRTVEANTASSNPSEVEPRTSGTHSSGNDSSTNVTSESVPDTATNAE